MFPFDGTGELLILKVGLKMKKRESPPECRLQIKLRKK
jgi:hypothetical protein